MSDCHRSVVDETGTTTSPIGMPPRRTNAQIERYSPRNRELDGTVTWPVSSSTSAISTGSGALEPKVIIAHPLRIAAPYRCARAWRAALDVRRLSDDRWSSVFRHQGTERWLRSPRHRCVRQGSYISGGTAAAWRAGSPLRSPSYWRTRAWFGRMRICACVIRRYDPIELLPMTLRIACGVPNANSSRVSGL